MKSALTSSVLLVAMLCGCGPRAGSAPPSKPDAVATPDPVHDPAPRAGGAPAASPRPSDGDLAELYERGITQVDETTYDVDHTMMEQIGGDSLARGCHLVPAVKGGKPDGFKLYAIRPTSLFARLGFANGDTVRRVDGRDLSSADRALEIYAALRNLNVGQTILVTLDRRGRPLTLTYRVR